MRAQPEGWVPEPKARANLQIKAVELNGAGKKYHFAKSANSNFEDFWALKNVSFNISKGHVFGIIGRNGAGKTTLLNIIAGVLTPTEGKVSLNGRVLGLFNLGVGFQDELTGRENIFLNGAILGAAKKEIENRLNSIIEFSEIGDFIDMPLGSYSQGMRLRLGFGIVANLDFDILVIDEVFAVGDGLFQSKCYERLMDFRRLCKTLIITSQGMDMIERLCDEVMLLDHGHILFQGKPKETIDRYRALLNTEKFFTGPESRHMKLVENTKKWADDVANWGRKLGTKEVVIDSVEFINRFGLRCNKINTAGSLKINVAFSVRNRIKEPHFGIAIFREDGVYCYGPNTGFDGHDIPELKPGRGYFTLEYKRLLLAPGNYRVSVAIWDKNETLAFNYHEGYYKLAVVGYDNRNAELLNIPFKTSYLKDRIKETDKITVKLFNSSSQEKDRFMTNEPVRFVIKTGDNNGIARDSYLWLGIYRDDGIYCQSILAPFKKDNHLEIFFPKLSLLPGSYNISAGFCNRLQQKFLIRHDNACSFQMVFNRQDHGTVYLTHKWNMEA